MNNEKKLKLEGIKVESFITSLNNDELKAVKGGIGDPQPDRTAVPIFC
ncbi:MAG: pinensin family lanthipeptide [Candidatus Aminicenantes bacterium]|nr:pinensin family lanthipeptide [Candidatus Aminicenantes bacterium]